MWVQGDLDLTDELKRRLPRVWERCLSGRGSDVEGDVIPEGIHAAMVELARECHEQELAALAC